jgi:hypothetical protein
VRILFVSMEYPWANALRLGRRRRERFGGACGLGGRRRWDRDVNTALTAAALAERGPDVQFSLAFRVKPPRIWWTGRCTSTAAATFVYARGAHHACTLGGVSRCALP